MEEFFEGLDSKLRMSGKMADSIMMGIVNSAMEEAYEKSCSKEGDLERLNQKSRFCELAAMQLEWCLKFLQEEMDSYIDESTCGREKLFSELYETRERILHRLEETELAFAEKDIELIGRKKSEVKLRLALEGKDEEILSLYGANEIQRKKSERLHGFLQSSSISDVKRNFNDEKPETRRILKEVEEQMDMLMEKLGTSSFAMVELREEDPSTNKETDVVKVSGDIEDDGSYIEQLKKECEEIAANIDLLKEKVDSGFESMECCMSLFEVTLADQQWKQNVEREITDIVMKNFLNDIYWQVYDPRVHPHYSSPPPSLGNWSVFLNEISELHNELEVLLMQKELQSNQTPLKSPVCVRSKGKDRAEKNISLKVKAFLENKEFGCSPRKGGDDAVTAESRITNHSLSIGKSYSQTNLSKQDLSRSFVPEAISCKFKVKQENEETNWVKASPNFRDDKDHDYIPRIMSRLKGILKHANSGAAHGEQKTADDGRKVDIGREQSGLDLMNQDFETTERRFKTSSNSSFCHLMSTDFCRQPNELKQDCEDMETTLMVDEIYAILFKGLLQCSSESSCCTNSTKPLKHRNLPKRDTDVDIEVLIVAEISAILLKGLLMEFPDFGLETLVGDYICRSMFSKLVRDYTESPDTEELVFKEVTRVVYGELFKDVKYCMNRLFAKFKAGYVLCKDSPHGPNRTSGNDAENGVDLQSSIDDSILCNSTSNFVETDIHSQCLSFQLEGAEEHNDQITNDSSNGIGPGNQKFGDPFSHLELSMMQKGELGINFQLPLDIMDAAENKCPSNTAIQNEELVIGLPAILAKGQTDLAVLALPLKNFSQAILDFELILCDKMRLNTLRLEDLNKRLNPVSEQINSIKEKELLYRKAFTRRCHDLQTAEAEVDLLGDQAELLFNLLQKIYAIFDHYSPKLKQYAEIMNVLNLIRTELNGEAASNFRDNT